MVNEQMNTKAHWWFLVALAFLVVATVLGFSTIQANLDDHERLDKHACELATKNREFFKEAINLIASDQHVEIGIKAKLDQFDKEVTALIRSSKTCAS